MIPELPANVAQLIEKEAIEGLKHWEPSDIRGTILNSPWIEKLRSIRGREPEITEIAAFDFYAKGMKAQALKAQKLVKELENIRDGYDHDEDAHKYNNLAACRVCSAEAALKQYNSNI